MIIIRDRFSKRRMSIKIDFINCLTLLASLMDVSVTWYHSGSKTQFLFSVSNELTSAVEVLMTVIPQNSDKAICQKASIAIIDKCLAETWQPAIIADSLSDKAISRSLAYSSPDFSISQ